MRKDLCAETPSVNRNDSDWLGVYRAAAMEFDRDKLPASIEVAEKATEVQRCDDITDFSILTP